MPQGFNNSELIRSPIRSIPQARQKAYDFPENKKDILEKSPGPHWGENPQFIQKT